MCCKYIGMNISNIVVLSTTHIQVKLEQVWGLNHNLRSLCAFRGEGLAIDHVWVLVYNIEISVWFGYLLSIVYIDFES